MEIEILNWFSKDDIDNVKLESMQHSIAKNSLSIESSIVTSVKVIVILLCALFITKYSVAQTINFSVIDSVSKEPLAFASVTYKKQNYLSDHLGKVKLQLIDIFDKDTVYITYIGYSIKKISLHLLTNNTTVSLSPNDYQIEDVTISGYNKETLFQWVKNGILSIRKNTKPIVARISTFTYNDLTNEPLEYLDGIYNLLASQTSFVSTELLKGGIVFKKDNLYSNYMSVGNTRLLVSSNISGVNDGYFFNPFLQNYKTIKTALQLDYKVIDQNTILIYFNHPIVSGTIMFDKANMSIITSNYKWTYNQNLPIRTLTSQAKLSDTMNIVCTHYFDNNKLKSQYLVMQYHYNSSPIVTHSYLTYVSDGNHHSPIGGIDYNNDYLDILTSPAIETYQLLSSQSDDFIQLINNEMNLNQLIEGKDVDRNQIEELTGLSYFSADWLLNWGLFPECNEIKGTDSNIKLGLIFSNDTSSDTFKKVKLYLDYFGSTYCYEKNENGATYVLMVLLIGEKYRKKLESQLHQMSNVLAYNNLIKIHSQAIKEMNAEIWRMKFETNGGYKSDQVTKWQKMLVEYFPAE